MATRKGSRGPRICTYVLKVNEQTGEVLEALREDPVTGERKAVAYETSLKGTIGKRKIPGPDPGDRGFPTITPINRMGGMTHLHIRPVVTPDPSPERKARKRR